MRIHRVWKKGVSSKPRILWEFGDLQWDKVSDTILHYRVVSRWKEQEEIHEQLQLLPESAIPLEALSRHLIGSEWVVEDYEEPTPLAFQQESVLNTTQIKKVNNPPLPPESSVDQIFHEQLKQGDQESQVIASLQPFYNLPTELWCSLSQWIPSNALFQPSLHLQADLELSDIHCLSN